jgi:N-acetyl-gamma-glutamyl-phosphate reductase
MKTAVIGASGYAGGELLRLLSSHPTFKPTVISAGQSAGELITSVHPQLFSYSDRIFSETSIESINSCELVFLALPHGESAKLVSKIAPGVKVIDLGADFRLSNSDDWVRYYGGEHPGKYVYGLPEIKNQRAAIAKSSIVANPGCYATAIALAAAPAIDAKIIDESDLVVVAASGTTGAGRNAKINLLGSEVMNSLTSYKFGGVHQHTPEIEEILSTFAKQTVKVSFTPILAPLPRGILATVTSKLTASISESEIRALYAKYFTDDDFVVVLPKGAMPQTSAVLGTNMVQIQVAVDSHTNRLVISSAIDNLGKGAAGQAIQNANLICGLPENSGLTQIGVK